MQAPSRLRPDATNILAREEVAFLHVLDYKEAAHELTRLELVWGEAVVYPADGLLYDPDCLDHGLEITRLHGEGDIRPTELLVQNKVFLDHRGSQGHGGYGGRASLGMIG